MSKKYWIKDLSENDILGEQIFLVSKKTVPISKNNRAYLNLTLSDKTGHIDARVWDNVDLFKKLFEQGDYIKISGKVTSYQRNLQMIVHSIQKVDPQKVNPSDFLQTSEYDPQDLTKSLVEFIESIENVYLLKLLKKIFKNQYIFKKYQYSPAGKIIHHAYIHGLLEHSLSVASLCENILNNYENIDPPIDRDLVIAGALLHDLGKIYELDYSKGFTYTTEGQLIGHVVLGYQMMVDVANSIDGFPHKLIYHLGHLILSHQGRLEYGSPKTPMTMEAFILHSADELDSKLNMLSKKLPRVDEKSQAVATEFIKSIDGYAINTHDDINILKDSDIPAKRDYRKFITEDNVETKIIDENSGKNSKQGRKLF